MEPRFNYLFCWASSPLNCELHSPSTLKKAWHRSNGWINKCINKHMMQWMNISLCSFEVSILTHILQLPPGQRLWSPSSLLSMIRHTVKGLINIHHLNDYTDMGSLLKSLPNSMPAHIANLSSTLHKRRMDLYLQSFMHPQHLWESFLIFFGW